MLFWSFESSIFVRSEIVRKRSKRGSNKIRNTGRFPCKIRLKYGIYFTESEAEILVWVSRPLNSHQNGPKLTKYELKIA